MTLSVVIDEQVLAALVPISADSRLREAFELKGHLLEDLPLDDLEQVGAYNGDLRGSISAADAWQEAFTAALAGWGRWAPPELPELGPAVEHAKAAGTTIRQLVSRYFTQATLYGVDPDGRLLSPEQILDFDQATASLWNSKGSYREARDWADELAVAQGESRRAGAGGWAPVTVSAERKHQLLALKDRLTSKSQELSAETAALATENLEVYRLLRRGREIAAEIETLELEKGQIEVRLRDLSQASRRPTLDALDTPPAVPDAAPDSTLTLGD